MGLESFHCIQTPTKLVLRSQASLPHQLALRLVLLMLSIGLPLISMGVGLFLQIAHPIVQGLAGLLVMAGSLPLIITLALLLDSLLTQESCIFDKRLGRVLLWEQQGFAGMNLVQHPLEQILDVQVQEGSHTVLELYAQPTYQIVMVLEGGTVQPLSGLVCYYPEIAQETVGTIRQFLNLSHPYRVRMVLS